MSLLQRLGLVGLPLLLVACAESPTPSESTGQPSAGWQLETRALRLGEIAHADRVVAVPTGQVPRAFLPPDGPDEIEILSVETLPLETRGGLDIHRTRVALRARAAGHFEWPARRVAVEVGAGAANAAPLTLSALSFTVAPVLPTLDERTTPFGLRRPASLGPGFGDLPAALGGALATLLLFVGTAHLARRLRAREKSPGRATRRALPPWETLEREIASLREHSGDAPFANSHALAAALRRYVGARYGVACESRTAEELAAAEPVFAARSAWPEFTRLVGELDALRFQARASAAQRVATALPEWLARAERWRVTTTPPEHRS